MRRGVLLVVALLLLQSGVADAHSQIRNDGNDTSGPLDIRTALLSHDDGVLGVAVITGARWRSSLLRHENAFFIDFDTQGGPQADYYVSIFFNRRLKANLWKAREGDRDRFIRSVSVFRSQDSQLAGKSVGITLNISALHPRGGYLRWYAASTFKTQQFCRDICYDFAPNRTMYRHAI